MNNKLKELYEKVSGDDSLKESFVKELEAISNDNEKKDYVINFAKEQGITLTDEDLPDTDGVNPIHDDDLDNVSGGREIGCNAFRECKDLARAACVACLATAGFMDC